MWKHKFINLCIVHTSILTIFSVLLPPCQSFQLGTYSEVTLKLFLSYLMARKLRLLQWSELLGKYTGIFFSSLEMDQTKAAQEISIYDQRQIPTAWNKAFSVKMQPLKSGDENWTLRSILHFVWKTCASHQTSLRILNTKRTDENKNG